MAEKFTGDDPENSREEEILKRDSLCSPEERANMLNEKAKKYLKFHNLLISRGVAFSPNEIPVYVVNLQRVLEDIYLGLSDVNNSVAFMDEFGDFEGFGLEDATPEQKKAFLTQLLQDEEVKAAIFPETA